MSDDPKAIAAAVKAGVEAGIRGAKGEESPPKEGDAELEALRTRKEVLKVKAEIAKLQELYGDKEGRGNLTFEQALQLFNDDPTSGLSAQLYRMHPTTYRGEQVSGWLENVQPPIELNEYQSYVATEYGGNRFNLTIFTSQSDFKRTYNFSISGRPKLSRKDYPDENEEGEGMPRGFPAGASSYGFNPADQFRQMEERWKERLEVERSLREQQNNTLLREIQALGDKLKPTTDRTPEIIASILSAVSASKGAEGTVQAEAFRQQGALLTTLLGKETRPVFQEVLEVLTALPGIMGTLRGAPQDTPGEDSSTALVKGALRFLENAAKEKQEQSGKGLTEEDVREIGRQMVPRVVETIRREMAAKQISPPAVPNTAGGNSVDAVVQRMLQEAAERAIIPLWPNFAAKLPAEVVQKAAGAQSPEELMIALAPHISPEVMAQLQATLADDLTKQWILKSFEEFKSLVRGG
jgi:hypothetical protein